MGPRLHVCFKELGENSAPQYQKNPEQDRVQWRVNARKDESHLSGDHLKPYCDAMGIRTSFITEVKPQNKEPKKQHTLTDLYL